MKNFSKIFLLTAIFSLIFGVFLVGTVQARGVLTPRADDSDTDFQEDEEELTNADVRDLVEDEFGDDHPMVAVARCESSFRQFASDGDSLRNPESDAIGIFQLLESYHEEPAEELGLDIFSITGNIGYARKLYDSFGLQPWSPSSLCWDQGDIAETTPTVSTDSGETQSTKVRVRVREDGELVEDTDTSKETETNTQVAEPLITKKLVSGVSDEEVLELQKLLNRLGYELSATGPGSPGEETDFFGAKTRGALQEFQCDKDIICTGEAYSTGYGLVDERTRSALNEAASSLADNESIRGGLLVREQGSQTTTADDTEDEVREENSTSSTEDLSAQLQEIREQIINLQRQLN